MKDESKAPMSSDKEAVEIINRWTAMKAQRSNWDILWDNAAKYIAPRKGNILTKLTSGQDQTINLYDSTAEEALLVFAAGVLTHIVPAGEKWFSFEPKSEDASPAVKEWLDEVTDIAVKAIGTSSNFYTNIHEDFLDAGTFGTSCLFLEDGKRRAMNFINVPVGTFCIEEDAEGMVDTVGREWKWTARQAAQKWGRDKLGKQVQEELDSKTPSNTKKFTFIHFIEPRRDANYQGGRVFPLACPIRSVYLCLEDKNVIEEDGYYEMPYFVSRLLKSNNEVYGRGPGIQTLPEIKLVNAMERDLLAATEKMVNPSWLMPDDTAYAPDNRPGGITYWDTSNKANMPQQVELRNNLDLGEKKTEQKREKIRRGFYNDLFKMLTSMDEQRREKTAYEVQQMVAEKLVLFSPLFARLCEEKLEPMLTRVVGILDRTGMLPPPPPEIQGSVSFNIVYTSKIALAIKSAENQSFATMLTLVEQMAQLDPSVANLIKWRDGARRIARNVGLPAKLLRTDREVDDMTAAQQKQAQQMQQAQAAELATRSAKNLGPEAQQKAANAIPAGAAA